MRLYKLKYWFWFCVALSLPFAGTFVEGYQYKGPTESYFLGTLLGAVAGFGVGTMLWIVFTAPLAWTFDFIQRGDSKRAAYLKGFSWFGVALGLGYLFILSMMDAEATRIARMILGVAQPICLLCAILSGVMDWAAKRKRGVDGPIHTFGPDGKRIATTPHASMQALTWVLPALGGVLVLFMLFAR